MTLYYKGIKVDGRKYDVHRYVMEQHLGRKLRHDEVVHHLDGNKHNNSIDNLQLVTGKEHRKLHEKDFLLRMTSEAVCEKRRKATLAYYEAHKHPSSHRVLQIDPHTGNVIAEYGSYREATDAGFNHRHISACCRGIRKTHGGFIWKYADMAQQ